MEPYIKSIKPVIEAKFASFTEVEKTIGDFFLKNTKQLDFSSKAISSRLFISEASLSRFAKKCGFDGYRSFIYEYKTSLKESEKKTTGITKTVYDTYQELLRQSYGLVDEKQVTRVVNMVKDAGRIYSFGRGSSALVASEMESRFMRIGIDIDSISDSDRMKMQTVFLNEKSLVFGFSLSGSNASVLYLMKEAHVRGAKSVLITANDDRSLLEFCDEVVLVASTSTLHYGNVLSPQFPLLVILDVIYNEIVNTDRGLKSAIHEYTLRALNADAT